MTTPKRALLPFEIFKAFNAAQTREERINILRENEGFVLNTILYAGFSPIIKFGLPEGSPPYQPDDGDPDESLNRMPTALKDLPLLLAKDKKLDPLRKEVKFIGLLESINQHDAKIIIAMKDKKLTEICPELTLDLVREAIPGVA